MFEVNIYFYVKLDLQFDLSFIGEADNKLTESSVERVSQSPFMDAVRMC